MPSLSQLLCILLAFLLIGPSLSAEAIAGEDDRTEVTGGPPERIHFADDHYEVTGSPRLNLATSTPVFKPGENATLRIVLANNGKVEELIPRNSRSGEEAYAAQEMREEERCTEAIINSASLSAEGPIKVVGGPYTQEEMPFLLPSGSVVPIEFKITIDEAADGVYDLLVKLMYDYQIDVSVTEDSVIPLFMPIDYSQKIRIAVEGVPVTFDVASVKSVLSPGDLGNVILAIRNSGQSPASSCSIQLKAAPPFQMITDRLSLGDIGPGEVAVARFEIAVDKGAHSQEYLLASEITYLNGTSSLSIPVALKKGSNMLYWILPALLICISAAAVFYYSRTKKRKTRRVGSLRRRSILDRLLKR